jgi:hypothetical protein
MDCHENYILIHEFMYPDEPMKQWVREDPESTGDYHKDWNWLMPVVEKIDSVLPDDSFAIIEHNRCIIPVLDADSSFDIEYNCNSRIEATYQSVVQFIKHYNSL